jgi:hypothetical protein
VILFRFTGVVTARRPYLGKAEVLPRPLGAALTEGIR